ncbi:hypothetical protein NDGK_00256 [Clostridiales bacterium CHKCI001]|nr:hypothetical protein NDGK_00256 [Clostridiales bacterium CHKCI001]
MKKNYKFSIVKKLIVLLVSVALALLIIRVVMIKQEIPDSGVENISTYEEAMTFSGGGTVLSPVFDSLWKNSYTMEQYKAAPIIAVVQSNNRLKQYDYLLSQEVTVKKVLQGTGVSENEIIYISDFGFANYYRGLRFYSTTNILNPSQEYIVFLSAYEGLNRYVNTSYYNYAVYGPGAFPLESDNSQLIMTSEEETKYQDVKDYAYFVSIPEFWEEIQRIKTELLREYKLVE